MKKALTTKTAPVGRTLAEKIKYARDFLTNDRLDSPDRFLAGFVDYMDAKAQKRILGTDKITDKDLKMFKDAHYVLGLGTHEPLAESVPYDHRLFVVEMAERTVREYGCTTAIEISLAETVALSYVRVLWLSKVMTAYTRDGVGLTDEVNDYIRTMSKELDRAHRQMASAIFTLRQLKMPQMSFNIKAKTAFIANNQQINDKQ